MKMASQMSKKSVGITEYDSGILKGRRDYMSRLKTAAPMKNVGEKPVLKRMGAY